MILFLWSTTGLTTNFKISTVPSCSLPGPLPLSPHVAPRNSGFLEPGVIPPGFSGFFASRTCLIPNRTDRRASVFCVLLAFFYDLIQSKCKRRGRNDRPCKFAASYAGRARDFREGSRQLGEEGNWGSDFWNSETKERIEFTRWRNQNLLNYRMVSLVHPYRSRCRRCVKHKQKHD